MSKGRFSPKVAALIWARDEGACVICGVGLWWEDRGNSWSIHHRCPRGMGGSRAPWVGQAANGLLLCGNGTSPGCHRDVEINRAESYEKGWLVRRNGVLRPAAVPVQYRDGLFFLTDDGDLIKIDTTPF